MQELNDTETSCFLRNDCGRAFWLHNDCGGNGVQRARGAGLHQVVARYVYVGLCFLVDEAFVRALSMLKFDTLIWTSQVRCSSEVFKKWAIQVHEVAVKFAYHGVRANETVSESKTQQCSSFDQLCNIWTPQTRWPTISDRRGVFEETLAYSVHVCSFAVVCSPPLQGTAAAAATPTTPRNGNSNSKDKNNKEQTH